jgi:hypothetical protein
MSDLTAAPATRDWRLWTGWTLSGLAIAFLLLDATMKLLALPIVLQYGAMLGFPGATMARMLGAILLAATLLYAWPRTSVLGAILLTGYLGGAVATKLRLDAPLFSNILFGVYVGLFVWGGLWMRDARLRALLPIREADG